MLEKVRNDRYDVILLDLTMPGMDGLELLSQPLDIRPPTGEKPILLHGPEKGVEDGTGRKTYYLYFA